MRDESPLPGQSAAKSINFLTPEAADRKKYIQLIVGAVTALFLLFGAYIAHALMPTAGSSNPLAYNQVTLEPKPPENFFERLTHFVLSPDVTLSGERGDRVNVLLLGMGGDGHDGPYLSDTMIIASLKPSTKQIALISIPRDLLVDIPGHGKNKINAANSFGEIKQAGWGGALAATAVKDTFNLEIPYYIRVDFQAFADIIDAVDGVVVNVDRSFTDPMYPADNNGYKTVSFARGAQTLDGRAALEYARSRHGSGEESSDFARSQRQQKILLALKEKIFSASTLANPVRLKTIMDSLQSHITTNLNFADLLALVRLGRTLDTTHIRTLTLDTSAHGYLQSTVGSDGAFLLVPKTGNFTSIQKAIVDIFTANAEEKNNQTPTQKPIVMPPAALEIQNGTWHAGLAARLKKRLEGRAFTIATIGNMLNRPQTRSGIFAIKSTAPRDIIYALQEELHIPILTDLPANVTPSPNTDILILLGEDIRD